MTIGVNCEKMRVCGGLVSNRDFEKTLSGAMIIDAACVGKRCAQGVLL